MKNMERAKSVRLIFKFALLVVYLLVLSYLLFFAESMGRTSGHYHTVNLVPFHEIKRYISNVDSLGLMSVLINVLGNVVVFIPFGFLIPAMWQEDDKNHPIGIFVLSLVFSAAVELLQFVTNVGSADVDDCILNTSGGMLGYLLYVIWRKIRYGSLNVDEEQG